MKFWIYPSIFVMLFGLLALAIYSHNLFLLIFSLYSLLAIVLRLMLKLIDKKKPNHV